MQEISRTGLDLHRGDEDQRLRDRRQRVAGIEDGGEVAVRRHLAELHPRRRRRERADAEGVEEVGDRAEADGLDFGREFACVCALCAARRW